MKCIGEECSYFYPHDFYASVGCCSSHNTSFTDYKNHNCVIGEDIQEDEQKLYKKKQVAERIKHKNKE